MKIRHCPDCTTGWRYADDLPAAHTHTHSHGLVHCPTCKGQGRTIDHEENSARVIGREAALSNVALIFSTSRAQA